MVYDKYLQTILVQNLFLAGYIMYSAHLYSTTDNLDINKYLNRLIQIKEKIYKQYNPLNELKNNNYSKNED